MLRCVGKVIKVAAPCSHCLAPIKAIFVFTTGPCKSFWHWCDQASLSHVTNMSVEAKYQSTSHLDVLQQLWGGFPPLNLMRGGGGYTSLPQKS